MRFPHETPNPCGEVGIAEMITQLLMVTLDFRQTVSSASKFHVFRRVSCCSLSCEKCEIEDDALSAEKHLAPSSKCM